jgi:hypothetical protein
VLCAFGPLAAACVAVGVLATELWRVRTLVVAGVPPDLEFVPSYPSEHPWLDEAGFRCELVALAELGFQPLADYSITYPGAPDGFARVLVNPSMRVYAEVNQVRQGAQTVEVATQFVSSMEKGWSLQTSGREAMPVAVAFMRAPRALWRSIPGVSLAELLDDHVRLRARLCRDLAIHIGADGTIEAYFEAQRTDHRARAEALRHTNVITGIIRGLRGERTRTEEWLGEYGAHAPA